MKPGWDWTTLCSLYADVDTYTEQLRALEHYVTANPNAIEARFLLVYHYMTSGHGEAAARTAGGCATESEGPIVCRTLTRADDDGARAATRTRRAGQARPSLHYRRRLESHSRDGPSSGSTLRRTPGTPGRSRRRISPGSSAAPTRWPKTS